MSANLENWNVEDQQFWDQTGKKVANRNLWISIPNLLLGFAIWLMWSIIIGRIQDLHEANPAFFPFLGPDSKPVEGDAYRALLYNLPAIAGLAGATLRIPNSFIIALSGGRNSIALTSFLMLIPTLGSGIALQNPNVSFNTLAFFALFSGVGGGAFASSMSNISFFFPKRVQGTSLGLNAGLGNLGVSVSQVLLPIVMTFSMFGAFSGVGFPTVKGGVEKLLWIQNAGFVWVPILVFFTGLAWFFMDNLPIHNIGSTGSAVSKFVWLEILGFAGAGIGTWLMLQNWGISDFAKIFIILFLTVIVTLALMRFVTPKETKEKLVTQFAIFNNKHNWIMTLLYVMTFGSFIGFSSAFPKLISDVFGYIRVDAAGNILETALKNPNAPNWAAYAWLAPLVGSLIRPVGGWLSDKIGGAKVTHWDTILMIFATFAGAYFVKLARLSPTPEFYFLPFLFVFLLLFVTTGIGNGSTFRMIPIIFKPEQAGPVLGWTSAVAAYGAFIIPNIFGTQIKAGTPEVAMYGFAGYYVVCLVVNWYFYARSNAEIIC